MEYKSASDAKVVQRIEEMEAEQRLVHLLSPPGLKVH